MRDTLRASVAMLAILTLLTGVAYPLAVTAVAQVAFPDQANGSLVARGGEPVGSALVGQSFAGPGYFRGRPSATPTVPYNAASSGGSNLGPLNPALRDSAMARVAEFRRENPGSTPVPADLVAASGSGLDPHISPAAAAAQALRVATARGMAEGRVRHLVARYAEGRQWGFLGEPRVNVLLLNLALDCPEPAEAARREFSLPNRHTLPSPSPIRLRTYLTLDDILGRGGPPHGERSTRDTNRP